MAILNKIFEWVNRVVGWLLIVLFATMTVAYFGQVVLRYAFQSGVVWTEEITRYSQVALIMFGAAILAGKNTHINVSVLESILKGNARKWAMIIQQLITAAFFGVAIIISFQFIDNAGTQVSTNMRIPMAAVYTMFPIAFSVLVFNVVVWILNTLREKPEVAESAAEEVAS